MQDYSGCSLLRAYFFPCCTNVNVSVQTLKTLKCNIDTRSSVWANHKLFAASLPSVPSEEPGWAIVHPQFCQPVGFSLLFLNQEWDYQCLALPNCIILTLLYRRLHIIVVMQLSLGVTLAHRHQRRLHRWDYLLLRQLTSHRIIESLSITPG